MLRCVKSLSGNVNLCTRQQAFLQSVTVKLTYIEKVNFKNKDILLSNGNY